MLERHGRCMEVIKVKDGQIEHSARADHEAGHRVRAGERVELTAFVVDHGRLEEHL